MEALKILNQESSIAIQAKLIGRATMLNNDSGEATLIIDSNLEEVREGDYFVVGESLTLSSSIFPCATQCLMSDARILDIEFGRSIGGQKDTVIVNLGAQDQIESGHLLSLQKADNLIEDPTARRPLRIDGRQNMLTF